MVATRARSSFSACKLVNPSPCVVAAWNLTRKIRSSRSCRLCSSSVTDRSRNFSVFSAFILLFLRHHRDVAGAHDEARLQRQLVGCQLHGVARGLLGDTFHLEQNPAWLDNSYPMVRCAFALTHTRFSGLLGHRLVRENANPQLAAALDVARNGHTRRFNLAVGDPIRLHRFQTVHAESQRRSTPGFSGAAAALLLAKLHFLR